MRQDNNTDDKQQQKTEETISNSESGREDVEGEQEQQLPLMALNHVSRLCRDVNKSVDFYVNVLGFVQIKRPPALKFDGAWLFNYGIGIHLVQSKEEERLPDPEHELDPMDNHISFQCEDMAAMERKLKERNIKYKKRTVGGGDDGAIDQLFFTDPDGFMVEICNCENLKLEPAGNMDRIRLPSDRHNPPVELNDQRADSD
ncbi:hypothetical protein MKW92_008852 [Papaver armeniacum]|nr:hypothetical protein MKW92_008852 [Papaver armeniacum]